MTREMIMIWIYRVLAILVFARSIQANVNPQKFVADAFETSTRNKFIWRYFLEKKHLQRPFFVITFILSLILLIIVFYI